MRRLLILALLLLAACQPRTAEAPAATAPAEPPAAAAPPSSGAMDISQPITALGTEPFWSVKIVGTTLTLTRPDAPARDFNAPGASIQPGRATWIATDGDGAQLTLTIYASECSDGMSDRKYPWTAELTLFGEALRGCAVKTAEMPAGG